MDNHASTFMANNINNLIGMPKTINNKVVKVYGGVIKVIGEGEVKWKIDKNYGQIQSIIIHNVNYVP